MWILWGILALMVLSLIALGYAILSKQKMLDAPFRGILMVDDGDPEGVAVYVTLSQPPGAFTDGEEVKLVVRKFVK